MDAITTAVSTALILMFLGGMVSNIGMVKSSKKIVAFGLILVLASLIVTRIIFSNFDLQPAKNPVIRYIYPWKMRERTKDNFFEIREIIGKHFQKGQPQNGCPLQIHLLDERKTGAGLFATGVLLYNQSQWNFSTEKILP